MIEWHVRAWKLVWYHVQRGNEILPGPMLLYF
jgi:hypothetical protein